MVRQDPLDERPGRGLRGAGVSHEELALTAYEAYRKTAGGPSFHQLTPEQRTAWVDAAEAVYEEIVDAQVDWANGG